MSRKKEIDKLDLEILEILRKEADITNKVLANRINLSEGPTLNRVRNLQKRGYLLGAQAKINSERLGYNNHFFITFSVAEEDVKALSAVLSTQIKIKKVYVMGFHNRISGMKRLFAVANDRSTEKFHMEFKELIDNLTFEVQYEIREIEQVAKEDLSIPL